MMMNKLSSTFSGFSHVQFQKKTTRPGPGGATQLVHPCQVETTGEATEAPPARASTEPGASHEAAADGAGESHGAGACAELGGTLQ